MTLRPVSMDFNYGSSFWANARPFGLRTLLLDPSSGDPTLYKRRTWWKRVRAVVEPIQQKWRGRPHDFPNYAAGSWGPAAADEMWARRSMSGGSPDARSAGA